MSTTETTALTPHRLFFYRIGNPVLWAMGASVLYWAYLIFNTQMEIKFDSIDYRNLGKMLFERGFGDYFRTGPHREPGYPLLIAASYALNKGLTFCSQISWLKILQCLILLSTQVLSCVLLKKLQVHRNFMAIAVFYLGFSPALVNSALSMYSEILTYPLILGFFLLLWKSWGAIRQQQGQLVVLTSLGLAGMAVLITFTKGAFELIIPVFLVFLLPQLFSLIKEKKQVQLQLTLIHLGLVLAVFLGAVNGYKYLNLRSNGNFVLTDRGSWALYGNTVRRTGPLSPTLVKAAIAYVPGEGVCKTYFPKEICLTWSAQFSDSIAFDKLHELEAKGIQDKEMNSIFINLSSDEIMKKPGQYLFFYFLEGWKMFFWESTQIGWVVYPPWLEKLFSLEILKNSLRLLISLLSLVTFLILMCHLGFQYLLRLQQQKKQAAVEQITELTILEAVAVLIKFIAIYIGVYAFFHILTRYALSIAPLYLILFAYTLDIMFRTKKNDEPLNVVEAPHEKKSLPAAPQQQPPQQPAQQNPPKIYRP